MCEVFDEARAVLVKKIPRAERFSVGWHLRPVQSTGQGCSNVVRFLLDSVIRLPPSSRRKGITRTWPISVQSPCYQLPTGSGFRRIPPKLLDCRTPSYHQTADWQGLRLPKSSLSRVRRFPESGLFDVVWFPCTTLSDDKKNILSISIDAEQRVTEAMSSLKFSRILYSWKFKWKIDMSLAIT